MFYFGVIISREPIILFFTLLIINIMKKRKGIIWELSHEDFKNLIKKSKTIGEVLKFFGLKNHGSNNRSVKIRATKENIDISHIKLGVGCTKGMKLGPKIPTIELFVENSKGSRTNIKNRIIQDNLIKYECKICKLTNEWNGKKLVLQLEHINGISDDNRLENLCFLCPNCHSQTPTYAGKKLKKHKIKKPRNFPRYKQRKVERPSKEKLEELIINNPMTTIGKMYGVSDNAIRKWAKSYGINLKSAKEDRTLN